MTEQVKLHGYCYSVYNRIARLALHYKQVEYEVVEVNPFTNLPKDYLKLQPFGRVPVLSHGAFNLFETSAITRYVDRAFKGQSLQPASPRALARMDQVIAIIDNYAYWPMIRQVFSHSVFRPIVGEPSSGDEIVLGLDASKKVLSVLEILAAEGYVLTGRVITLADCHLAPMLDYFVRADEGEAVLSTFSSLSSWWGRIAAMEMLQATDPKLSEFGSE